MSEKELRELDMWIAENVMGWERSHSSEYSPTTDPSAAMKVLKKCIEKEGSVVIYAAPDSGYIICSDDVIDVFGETLELAICQFAKKLFSK